MSIKLHYHPLSTYSRRVLIALTEKDIAYEGVAIDMAARKHKEAAYLALNPYGRVPTLEEDGFVLYESTAILDYLEATHPKPALTPTDARSRALVEMHMKLCDLQMTRPWAAIVFPKRFLPKERWNETAMAEARAEVDKHLAIVERQLGDRQFLVGDRFTLADLCYLPFLEFLPLAEIKPPPVIAAWSERLLARPSAQKTKPDH
jgi:glutathione S-transferase